jgi:competence ComEA-like helix-hairpin-helix protein
MHDAESRALRRAVMVLVLVSSARWAWAEAVPETQRSSGQDVLDQLLEESLEAVEEEAARSRPLRPGERVDPNRADEVELDRLPGVGPATARAIVTARERGLRFRRAEDLSTVRGIGDATVERLRPLLDLDRPPPAAGGREPSRSAGATSVTGGVVDVNTASADELTVLPGIGPALAQRILEVREKQMFRSVEDLERVSGIGPATVARLRPYVFVSGGG